MNTNSLDEVYCSFYAWSNKRYIDNRYLLQIPFDEYPYLHTSSNGRYIILYHGVCRICPHTQLNEISFTSIRPTMSKIWPTECLTLSKYICNLGNKITQVTIFNRIPPKFSQMLVWIGDKVSYFFSDQMSSSYFIMQTSRFLLFSRTEVTLGQMHRNVTLYNSPDLYFLCPKYVRYKLNMSDMGNKRWCSSRYSGCSRKEMNQLWSNLVTSLHALHCAYYSACTNMWLDSIKIMQIRAKYNYEISLTSLWTAC